MSLSPRPLVLLALAGVAPGLVLLASPAQAEVLTTPTLITGVTFTADSACTRTSGANATDSQTFAADGVARTSTSSGSATYSNADGTDVTSMSGTSTATIAATQSAGRLDTVTMTRSYSATLLTSLGAAQQCRGRVTDSGFATYAFDLPAPAYATVTLETRGGGGQVVVGSSTASPGAPTGISAEAHGVGPHAVSEGHALLPAGTHYVALQEADLQLPAPTPTSQPGTTASGSATVVLRLQVPGASTDAKAAGKGSKYVDLAAGRDCTSGAVPATWKKKAGAKKHSRIKKAVFYNDGVKVASVRKPTKKKVTAITGLAPTQPVDLSVVIKLAKKGAGKVEVSRSYLPCS